MWRFTSLTLQTCSPAEGPQLICQLTEGIQLTFMAADRGHTDYIYISWLRTYRLHLCKLTEGIQITFMSADRGHTAYVYASLQKEYRLHTCQLQEGLQLTFMYAVRAHTDQICVRWEGALFTSSDRMPLVPVWADWSYTSNINCQGAQNLRLLSRQVNYGDNFESSLGYR
jgi:hypothetical protein